MALVALALSGCARVLELDGYGSHARDAGDLVDAGDDVDAATDAGWSDAGPSDAGSDPDAASSADAGGAEAGPCGEADSDGDGVGDLCDVCPGGDDADDGDADGTPDFCDDWPCGATRPAVPLAWTRETITPTAVRQTAGGRSVVGNTTVANPGEALSFEVDWTLAQQPCGLCRVQLEYGLVPGMPFACGFDGSVPAGGFSGGNPALVAAPTTEGLYFLRLNLSRDSGCTSGWFAGAPPVEQSIVAICVAAP